MRVCQPYPSSTLTLGYFCLIWQPLPDPSKTPDPCLGVGVHGGLEIATPTPTPQNPQQNPQGLTNPCSSLCLTRTRVLKAEPKEDIGNDGEEVTNQEDGEDTEDINDGQGRAVQGKAI